MKRENRSLVDEALQLAEISPPEPTISVSVSGYGSALLWHRAEIRPFLAALARVAGVPLYRVVLATTIAVDEGDVWRDVTPPEIDAWGWDALEASLDSR